MRRAFVPREAYIKVTFGPSVEERAAARWISAPDVLLLAIERQRSMPVLPIGEALLNLGLVTPAQLDRALELQRGDVPLGEMLVSSGVISRSNLETAIAHKMGYPLVDLTRFPVEEAAARMLEALRRTVQAIGEVTGERAQRLAQVEKLFSTGQPTAPRQRAVLKAIPKARSKAARKAA